MDTSGDRARSRLSMLPRTVSDHVADLRRLVRTHTRLVPIVFIVTASIAFYFWTSLTSFPTDDVGRDGVGFYGMLGDAFVDGRLSLSTAPDPGLLALPDPYDPETNAAFRLHDASLYDGRYYLYFGPTPAVLLFAPARLLGLTVTEPFASAVFASIALVAAAWLVTVLLRRFAPQVGTAMTAAMVLVVGLANGVPFALRRPAVYETAITAGLACTMVVALLVAFALDRQRRRRVILLACAGIAAGLAVGSRPHLALIMFLPLFAAAYAWRTESRQTGLRMLAASGGPFVAILAVLGIYNALRFDSVLEFGSRYQLAGINMNSEAVLDFARLVPGIFFYFVSAPSFSSAFPFVTLAPEWPGGGTPDAYVGVEPVAGALALAPIIVMGLIAMTILAVRHSRRRATTGVALPLAMAATAIGIATATILAIPSATLRYEVDWLTLLLVASVVSIGIAMARATGWRRRAVEVSVVVLAGYSCFVGVALSMTGYYDALRLAHPGAYEALEDATSFVPVLASRVSGEPIVQRVVPAGPGAFDLQFVVGGRGPVVVTMSPRAISGAAPAAYRAEVRDPASGARASARAGADGAVAVSFGAHHGINRTTIRFVAVSTGRAAVPNLTLGIQETRVSYPAGGSTAR